MVGCAHGHDGDGLRSAAGAADRRGRGRAGGEAAVVLDESAGVADGVGGLAVEEPVAAGERLGLGRALGFAVIVAVAVAFEAGGCRLAGRGASGEVRSYDTDGGRVVFALGKTSASLVSATPASGWSMQVWKTETWIRVEFSSGADRVSVFCTWHDSAPRVEVNDY